MASTTKNLTGVTMDTTVKNHKIKKKISMVLITFLLASVLAFVCLLVINTYVKSSVKDTIITADEAALLDADCILVLGAGVWDGGRPSPMLEDRLLQGIELYGSGASNRLLMSGDHGRKEYDEVNVMKQFAIDRNIVSEHVFMDHAGFSTYESLYRARDIFEAKKIIIVTQEYHLYRALYIAEKLGLEAYGVASDPRQYAGQEYRELREIFARVKDFFAVIFKPEPTYLGKAIPVSGNGDLTND
jgi:SanA protein